MGGLLALKVPGRLEASTVVNDEEKPTPGDIAESIWETTAENSQSEQLRGGEALQDIDPKSLLEDEDLRFPAPLGPPAANRSKLDNLIGDKLIKSVAETLVNFQATAPAKPSPDYLQAAMRLCAVLLKLCGSVETLTAVHRSVYTAIEGVSIDVKHPLPTYRGTMRR